MSYIEKTLSEDEKILYEFKYHFIEKVGPIFLIIVGLISNIFTLFIPLILGIYRLISIHYTEQGVTTKRGYKKTGIISRNTEELLLTKVETVEIKQGVIGRLLDYGNIYLTGTGNSFLIFRSVTSPIEVKKNLDSLVN
ncbi:MAG: PH domain-containing protein [Candidatus Marinimicrobia bacterium]|jgi:hypothetical protein|nr:PH domain-containing protein [Candidatus Neomarinimicrobiota bacterium]